MATNGIGIFEIGIFSILNLTLLLAYKVLQLLEKKIIYKNLGPKAPYQFKTKQNKNKPQTNHGEDPC